MQFIEECWISPTKDKLAGKKYVAIINGSRESKDSTAYLENVLSYFKLEKAADSISCLAENCDSMLDKCEALGVQLA